MRHYSAENSFAQDELQEALGDHTQAHALSVQSQIEALGLSLAHESRRADAREAMNRDIAKSMESVTAHQLATLPRPDPSATQLNLDGMRAENTATTTAIARQEGLIMQIGNALGGVLCMCTDKASK